ncbi:SpoIID/LytB domain-containing protein [Rhodococcus hoagii]|uniref:SpoIID/LytB domain-containing protein n=1 Tax=Rhodococcus hoagii TaxID=43767 RepID=UPI000A115F05|nr:SpoIID/LytB domain-containing protein [Prescottella equi]MBM4519756.1 SpoIID/LytB domain-containing protein [Prescottella equi]MBM4527361.1 SpoIID/LytB domain-containing protein [Prescottella equi]MBM4546941.1 SpoIID/LytB domain-containing protein [Prescottella equi]MBM4573762.1 SpoIID/LytB domain-containing protein [Prescottella equi]MBM4604902.1 SpoIID/LytB domain-containing protein [Prescottella equi]
MATPRLRISADRVLRRRRPGRRPSRSVGRLAALGLVPALAVGAAVALTVVDRGPDSEIAPVVAADTPVTLYGHGYGHGRGMGQYGAYGYAKNFGWTAERIVGHYYGNTQLGQVADPFVAVRLIGRDDKRLDVYAQAGLNVAGRYFGPNSAAHLVPTPGGADVTVTEGCTGREIWRGSTNHPWVDPVNLGANRPANEHLRLCDGNVPYRGAMNATRDGNGAWRTVNRVLMEDYLYSVVPSESIPSWADSGGREALRAQAIAARSYAAAERRYGYAQTCDTQSCQVYRGSSNEDWRTTEAVRTTSGTVIKRGNQIMAAEFSSSSGGFTAGGVFPAVVDEGDVVSPNRNWQQTVTAGAIANAYGVGELISFDVIGRNNLGADGGRVTRVKVVGTARTVEGSGDEARWKLGLKSDWFTVGGPGAPGPIPGLPLPPGSLESLPLPELPPLPEITPGSVESLLPPLPPLPPGSAAPLPFAAAAGDAIAEPIAAPMEQAAAPAEESPIDAKYRELGGAAGTLGEPTGPELMLVDESGKFRTYAGGTIVWTPTLGTRVVDSSVVVQPAPAETDVVAG